MNKIVICLLFVLTVLASIACVSAVDVDNATSQTVLNVDDVCSNLVLDNHIDNVSLLTNSSECGVVDNQDNNSVNGTKLKITPPNLNDMINNNKGPSFKITLDIHGPNLNSKGSLALLQFKIDQASAGSTLYLDRDYKNNVANNIITVNKNLVIDGQGHSVDFANFKNCYFKSTKGDLTFRNLIIKNAYNDDDDYGGAFYLNNNNGKYIFDNCSVSHCWSQKSGGAIYAKTDKILTVKNCTFENNKINKDDGGAIWAKNDVVIESSVFKGNVARDDGGAVYSDKDYIFVSNSIFEKNTAGKNGGAIHSNSGSVEVQNCIFENNKLNKDDGGAIWAKNDVVIESSVFKGNVAGGDGGAVYSSKDNIRVSNSIFERNTADDKGGAIRSKSGSVEVQDSIFRINVAKAFTTKNGGAIYAKKDIKSTNCRYDMNIITDLCENQVKSEKGKVKFFNKDFNPVGDFDNIKNVSLNKKNVSFWVKDSKSLNDIFKFIESKKPVWENIVLTLSPDTEYKADFSNQFGFCLHLNTHLTIKGQSGSIIKGDGCKNSFIHIGNTAALALLNVTLRQFANYFINRGVLYCNNSFFSDINVITPRDIVSGGVIVNSGSALFDHCIFSTIYDNPVSYGSVLKANSRSLTIFSECDFNLCDGNFIWASDYSTVIVCQKDKIGENFKDCYFAKTACFSVISSELYNDFAVFNCSSADQLQKALYAVNSLTTNAVSVVINLQPGVYELDADWLSKKNFMRSMDWRDEYYHHSKEVNPSTLQLNFKNPGDEIERYALDVGAVPIIIMGHGSTVKLVNGNDKSENHFAFIGNGGKLSVSNITFSNFNSVFHNYGLLNLLNCTFSDNYDLDGRGAVVYGAESTVNFIDCIFNTNKAGNKNTDIADLVGGIVRFNSGCNFTNFFKTRDIIGSMSHNGLVEAPEGLKSKFILKDSSNFKVYMVNESVHCFNITSNNYQSQMDYMNNLTGLVILNLSDIKCNKLSALPSTPKLLVVGNGAHISNNIGNKDNGASINNGMYQTKTFVNVAFSNYDKLVDNHGLCYFINCSFVNNKCRDYLVSNNYSCSFINCKFINNSAKNLIFNDGGSIVFDNCSFINNSYSDKGLIFNKYGAINMFNCSILNSGEITVYNFETNDCNIWNTIGCGVKYAVAEKEKKSVWRNILHIGLMIVAGVAAVIAGAFVASLVLPTLVAACGAVLGYTATFALGALAGAVVGAAFGGLDYAVLGYFYGYPDAGSLMLQYVALGAICGFTGACIMSVHAHMRVLAIAKHFDIHGSAAVYECLKEYGYHTVSSLWSTDFINSLTYSFSEGAVYF